MPTADTKGLVEGRLCTIPFEPGLAGDCGFPHMLRAACATMLAECEIAAVQRCYTMGWLNLKIWQHYVHLAAIRTTAPKRVKEIIGG